MTLESARIDEHPDGTWTLTGVAHAPAIGALFGHGSAHVSIDDGPEVSCALDAIDRLSMEPVLTLRGVGPYQLG